MATKKKDESGKRRVLVPHKIGDEKWQVSLGIEKVDGKRKWKRKQFKTLAEARDFCISERARRKAHGAITAGVDGGMVAAWVDLHKKLQAAGAGSLLDVGNRILRDTLAIRTTGSAKECLNACHQAYVALKLRPTYRNDLLNRGGRFLRWYSGDRAMSEVSVEIMKSYFASLPSGGKTDRRTLSAWMGWAVEEGWLPTNPCYRKRRKGTKKSEERAEAVILSIGEARRLLNLAVQANEWVVLGYLVISLFGGVRPEEFRKRVKGTPPLDWTWDRIGKRHLVMPPNLAKTGVGRMIPVNNTLAEWLDFLTTKRGKPSGPILAAGKRGGWRPKWDSFRETHWVDAKGIPIGWTPDQLRHSYASYALAKSNDSGAVSQAMGNSEATLLKYYWNWRTLEEKAVEFFDLTPENVQIGKKSA